MWALEQFFLKTDLVWNLNFINWCQHTQLSDSNFDASCFVDISFSDVTKYNVLSKPTASFEHPPDLV